MSTIIKKIAFLLVLAGLLTWGVATMAHGPSATVTSDAIGVNVVQQQGHVMENGVEVDPSNIQHR